MCRYFACLTEVRNNKTSVKEILKIPFKANEEILSFKYFSDLKTGNNLSHMERKNILFGNDIINTFCLNYIQSHIFLPKYVH